MFILYSHHKLKRLLWDQFGYTQIPNYFFMTACSSSHRFAIYAATFHSTCYRPFKSPFSRQKCTPIEKLSCGRGRGLCNHQGMVRLTTHVRYSYATPPLPLGTLKMFSTSPEGVVGFTGLGHDTSTPWAPCLHRARSSPCKFYIDLLKRP